MGSRHQNRNGQQNDDGNEGGKHGRRGGRIDPRAVRSALTSGSRTAGEQLVGLVPDLKLVQRTPPAPAATPSEESLKEMAIRLQATGKFYTFATGAVQHLYLEDDGVIFERQVQDRPWGKRFVACVIATENKEIPNKFFIDLSQLREISEREDPADRRYFQRASTPGRPVDQDLENDRFAVMEILLKAIEAQGGSEAIKKAEADESQSRAADDLREQILAGGYSHSLLEVLDNKKVGKFGFVVDGKPYELQTGFIKRGKGDKAVMVRILSLTKAPMGLPDGTVIGNYCPTKELLWEEGHSSNEARTIAELLHDQWDEAEVDQVAAAQAAAMAPATQPAAEEQVAESA
jgi:hypothetical protein